MDIHTTIFSTLDPDATTTEPKAVVLQRPQPRLWVAEALEVCPVRLVARRVGVDESTVRGWRCGKASPNLDHLSRAPRAFAGRLLVLLGDHLRADSLLRVDPEEALRQMMIALGALLAQRKPLDQCTPEEAREIRDRAAVIEEQARALRQLAAEQARTVADKGAR